MRGRIALSLFNLKIRTVIEFDCPEFQPHPLFRGGHLQTLVGAWFPGHVSRPTLSIRRHIELSDGDTLTLHDDALFGKWKPGVPVTLLVHGMCGSAESPNIRRMAQKLQSRGIRTFRLNMRGCGDGKGLAREPYHAGRAEDIQTVVEEIRAICPHSPIQIAGFSLGGNIVLKWLGEYADKIDSSVVRAMAVNPPVDLETCTNSLPGSGFGMYDRYFAKKLFRHVIKCDTLRGKGPWTKESKQPRNILDFDEMFTAPQSGFKNANHYYEHCSSAQYVPAIKIPTLILSSKDDPVIPVHILEKLDRPKSVGLYIANSGGHLGFLGGQTTDPDRWWLDWRVLDWFAPESKHAEQIA